MRGFSFVELVSIVAILALLALIALPALARSRARANVTAAKNAFAATLALARQSAVQYGRLARLHLDPEINAFWVTVDTGTFLNAPRIDTVGPLIGVTDRFGGVEIDATDVTICFDPRGLATPRADCDLPNTTIVFRRGNAVDTVTLSRLGRLRR
jgi:Tfp pilus assembly protein FimT